MNISRRQSLQQLYPRHVEIPILIIVSALLLGCGLSLPLMMIEKMVFWNNEYSVITGIFGLFNEREYFLSALLFFFCLIFPITKLVTLWILWKFKLEQQRRNKILEWLGILGKWSMLDVFVVAILIVAVKLGPMASVTPRIGVYIFSMAIIVSISTALWVERVIKRVPASS